MSVLCQDGVRPSPTMRAVGPHLVLLIVHVLAAATTLGATVAYAVSIALAERHPEHLAFTIRAVRASDRVLAIPAYLVTLVTGVWIAIAANIPFDRFWMAASLVIYAIVLVVGFAVFGPVVRRELVALERGGTADGDYLRLRTYAFLLAWGTVAALVVMFALMIAKPR